MIKRIQLVILFITFILVYFVRIDLSNAAHCMDCSCHIFGGATAICIPWNDDQGLWGFCHTGDGVGQWGNSCELYPTSSCHWDGGYCIGSCNCNCVSDKCPDIDSDSGGCRISHAWYNYLTYNNVNCDFSWDRNERKCVFCDGKKELKICGDTTGLYHADNANCNADWCIQNGNQKCEQACGAAANCDEQTAENYCPTQGTWCNNTCAEIDRDSSQTACIDSGGNCVQKWWNIGGEVASTTCCGDDSGENYKTMDSGYDEVWRKFMTGDNSGDDACCNRGNDCTYQNTCYSAGDDPSCANRIDSDRCKHDVNGDGKFDGFCAWGWFYDCDSNSGDCGLCGYNWIPTGDGNIGEYYQGSNPNYSSSCCGDDLEENRVTCQQQMPLPPTGGVDVCNIPGKINVACCNFLYPNQKDCVFNGNCYSHGVDLDANSDESSDVKCVNGIWMNMCKAYSGGFSDNYESLPYLKKCPYHGTESVNQTRKYTWKNIGGNYECYCYVGEESSPTAWGYTTYDSYITKVCVDTELDYTIDDDIKCSSGSTEDASISNSNKIYVTARINGTGWYSGSWWFVGMEFCKAYPSNPEGTKTNCVKTWANNWKYPDFPPWSGQNGCNPGEDCGCDWGPDSSHPLYGIFDMFYNPEGTVPPEKQYIDVTCWVPASHWYPLNSNQRIMFWIYERDLGVDAGNNGCGSDDCAGTQADPPCPSNKCYGGSYYNDVLSKKNPASVRVKDPSAIPVTTTTYRRAGGGCPTLFTYDGKDYVKERKSSIHSQPGIDTVDDITLTTKPAVVDGNYLLSLKETTLPEHSYIDSVRLFITDSEGRKEAKLVSAKHSKYGDVTNAIAKSDDKRTDTQVFDEIKLMFAVPELKGEAKFTFEIEGYNPAVNILDKGVSIIGQVIMSGNMITKFDIADFSVVAAVVAVIAIILVFGFFKFFARKKKK